MGRVWITHSGMTKYGHPAHSPCHGNMLTNIVFLLHQSFQVSQGVTRAECVIPAHVVIVARAPWPAKLGKH